ncbi:MAG: N-6 DNA methylase [Pseudolysinimonas sp.]
MARSDAFVGKVEDRRVAVNALLDPGTRSELGQFMTPASVASVMAACISIDREDLKLLDPGAGVGSLTAAVVARIIDSEIRPSTVTLTAYEIDPFMRQWLAATLADCTQALVEIGVQVSTSLIAEDFVQASLRSDARGTFTSAILNPPFMKMAARGATADRLRSRGWSAANLYTAFWSAAIAQVEPGGDIVAVTPRSYCNGTYFAGFRRFLLRESALRCIHVFDARDKAFSEDGVLQETVITHSIRGVQATPVELSVSHRPGAPVRRRTAMATEVVLVDDPAAFVRLPIDERDDAARSWMSNLGHSLTDLGVSVSTGRVVDFRAREHLRDRYSAGLIPLLYPTHMTDGAVTWPKSGRKPNALDPSGAENLLTSEGHYTIVKRFSAKEERRRVVASYYDGSLGRPAGDGGPRVIALENHLNFFHMKGQPLPDWMARGLTMFLNSSMVDAYFREFNGHTQVNAGDLRSLRYPGPAQLRTLSDAWGRGLSQAEIDAAIDSV